MGSPILEIGCALNNGKASVKAPQFDDGNIRTVRLLLIDSLPYRDPVAMLAVLEYLDHPGSLLREIFSVLSPRRHLELIVPSKPPGQSSSSSHSVWDCSLVSKYPITKTIYDWGSLDRLLSPTGVNVAIYSYF
jgi:hypothetical protein